MTQKTAKGPVSVATTAELRAALVAGYTADEIVMPAGYETAVAAAREAGLAEGRAAGRVDALAEGAAAERERIKAVEAAILPGHEALIQRLKYDGTTTGPEAAAQVVNAEREKRGRRLEDLASDALGATVAHAPAPEADQAAAAPGKKPKIDPDLPLEDRCKAEWQHDAQIRSEFDSLETFIAFSRANESGQVRVLRDRTNRG